MMRRLMILAAAVLARRLRRHRRWPPMPPRARPSSTAPSPTCIGCHTDAKNPLAKAGAENTADELKAWVRTPKDMIAKKGKKGMMPAFAAGQDLGRRPRRAGGLPGHDEVDRTAARRPREVLTMKRPPRIARSSWGRPSCSWPPRRLRAQECLDCHGAAGLHGRLQERRRAATSRSTRRPGRPPSTARWASAAPTATPSIKEYPHPELERPLVARPHAAALHLVPAVPRGAVQEDARQRPPARARRRQQERGGLRGLPQPAHAEEDHRRGRQAPARGPGRASRRPARAATPRSTTQYRESVHGDALVHGNPDVPTCIDCHGVHDIPDPTHGPLPPGLAADVRRLPHRREADGEVQALDPGPAHLRGRLPRLDGDALPAPAPGPGSRTSRCATTATASTTSRARATRRRACR